MKRRNFLDITMILDRIHVMSTSLLAQSTKSGNQLYAQRCTACSVLSSSNRLCRRPEIRERDDKTLYANL